MAFLDNASPIAHELQLEKLVAKIMSLTTLRRVREALVSHLHPRKEKKAETAIRFLNICSPYNTNGNFLGS